MELVREQGKGAKTGLARPRLRFGMAGEAQTGVCYVCGYSLEGIAAERCPECSADIRPKALAAASERQGDLRRLCLTLFLVGLIAVLALLGPCLFVRDYSPFQRWLGSLLCVVGVGASSFICIRAMRRRLGKWSVLPGLVLGALLFAWMVFTVLVVTEIVRFLSGL
jgi:hypothetical protein